MSSGWLPSREPGSGGWTWAPGPVHFLSADGKAHREHREKLELVASFSSPAAVVPRWDTEGLVATCKQALADQAPAKWSHRVPLPSAHEVEKYPAEPSQPTDSEIVIVLSY